MTDLLSRLSGLKNEKERAEVARQRKQGELDALNARLKREFGFDSVEQAQTALKEMSLESGRLREKLEQMLDDVAQQMKPAAPAGKVAVEAGREW